MSDFPDQDKSYWHSICLRSLWYFQHNIAVRSTSKSTSSRWIPFPPYLSGPNLMLFSHPRWSIPFSTASIVLFEPEFCSTICLHVQCISLRSLSSYPAISSLLDQFISLSLSLYLVPSGPSLSEPWSKSLQPTFFSHSQRKGFTLLSVRNYFWRILSWGFWRPVVMRV